MSIEFWQKAAVAAFVAKTSMEYLYSKGEITMTLGDYYSGNTTREDGTHHWTWFATNGKSAQENYMIQR